MKEILLAITSGLKVTLMVSDYDSLGKYIISEQQWKCIMQKVTETGGDLLECLQEAVAWAEENFREYEFFTMIGM